ncbi:histidine kinase [Methanocella sp. CWC-04]|uniref:Histidine kinase n=1 Tax=Methanooceanicella nereidis TaxID=2052831 RepID=A0AAP2W5L1_9EURY|nr:CBS domain-containing protein [Methanocella sp. CWC-04]MCD1294433.1 histidine kinase [Methanocella sp. CWC-04]
MTEVGEIMSSPVFAVSMSDNLARARNLMLRNGVSRLVVMDGEDLKGIVTKKDLAARLNQAEPQWRRRPLDSIPVEIVMTPNPITVTSNIPVQEAAALMLENEISSLIVFDDRVKGIVTKHDLVKFFTLLGCNLRVGDMMSSNMLKVSRHHTINSIMDLMDENEAENVIVTDGLETSPYVGFINMADLGFVEINPRHVKDIKETRKESYAGQKKYRHFREAMIVAEDVMSTPLASVKREDKAVDAARIMVDNNYDALPVINGELTGQFNYMNILKWLSEAPE